MIKLCRIIFSRYFVSAILILAELAFIFYLSLVAYEYSWVALILITLIDIGALLSLVNKNANPEYKVSWLVVILALPTFGALLYAIFYSRKVSRSKARFMSKIQDNLDSLKFDTGVDTAVENDRVFTALKEISPLAAGKAYAILNDDPIANIYLQSSSKYFASGEEMYENMLKDIESATKYIFLEYFIVAEGAMWDGVHTLLRKKILEGVEVRLMYDDIGCMKTISPRYDRMLNAEGIRCRRFSPVSPRVSTAHNNRDHRKILVVDGKIAYTGGVNIADEYINAKKRFGHWKDGGIRVEGDAAVGFLKLFLSLWDLNESQLSDIKNYVPAKCESISSDGGFYMPLGSGPSPIYTRPVGKNLLLNIINQAEKYLYITTPYLIIDYDLTESLRNASLRGVDVRIVTPGKADKKFVKVMTKNAYPYLMEAGVRIYEYSPGFIHEKIVVSDDLYAVVGTINLDYRSLAHHYEDAVWIFFSPTVERIREEFLNTVSVSDQKGEEEVRLNFIEKILRNLIKIFAPLL